MNKKQFTHWLKVAVIGIALGLALQFVRAWTEPTQAPPNGNVGAPINTGATKQTKAGDICTTVTGSEKCLSAVGGATGPVCGNGFCESGENTSNCAGDCPAPYVPPAQPPCQCETAILEYLAYHGQWVACGSTYQTFFYNCTYLCAYPGSWVPMGCIVFQPPYN